MTKAKTILGLGPVTYDDDMGQYYTPPMAVPVLGGKKHCLVVEGYDGDRKPAEYHAAIANFLSIGPAVLKKAAPFVFQYYQDRHPDEEQAVTIASPAEVWRHVQFGEDVCISRRHYGDKGIYVSIECNCDWEEEHGLQLVFKNGLAVSKVGAFDGHVTNSDAYADPRFEKVVYVTRKALALKKSGGGAAKKSRR